MTVLVVSGYQVLVDDWRIEELSAYSWSAGSALDKRFVYFKSMVAGYLHRYLKGAPAGLLVDHRDGNTRDNRESNLRVCTAQLNAANRHKAHGASRFKGVHWDPERSRWRARVILDGRPRCLGRYGGEEAAARAYDAFARAAWGEFARLNFPESGEQSCLGGSHV